MYAMGMNVLGLMSGTSLDGMDMALVTLNPNDWGQWEILEFSTVPYPTTLKKIMQKAYSQRDSVTVAHAHQSFLQWTIDCCQNFRTEHAIDLIATHGQTLFHQPEQKETVQVGYGPELARALQIPTVGNFRLQDVLLGGQGAPFAPMGDALLFPEYTSCVNLGGFANISTTVDGKRVGWDIAPVNHVLNKLAEILGASYDEGGVWASEGAVCSETLHALNALPYYTQTGSKSLGYEFVDAAVWPLLSGMPPKDALATYVEHAAEYIGAALGEGRHLFTGGGVHNSYLMARIQHYSKGSIDVPEATIANAKEALIFALLGAQRWLGETNIWCSVTGSSKDHSSGQVFTP